MNNELRITKLRRQILTEVRGFNEKGKYPSINQVIHQDRHFLPARTKAGRYGTVHAMLDAGYLCNREDESVYSLEVTTKGLRTLVA